MADVAPAVARQPQGLKERILSKLGKKAEAPVTKTALVKESTNDRLRSEVRHIDGALQDPRTPETFQLLETSRKTFETVVFREYKACHDIIKDNAAMAGVTRRLRLGLPLQPADQALIGSLGLAESQVRFYVDFTSEGTKLDEPAEIIAHSSAYLNRTDRLVAAEQMAMRQLRTLQAAARADVVDMQTPAKPQKYEGDVFVFDDQGRSATPDEVKKGRFKMPWADSLQKRVQERNKQKKQNAKDQEIKYSGVRFLSMDGGKVKPVTSGNIDLTVAAGPAGAYARNLMGLNGAPGQDQLQGRNDMARYAQQITDLVHARVDFCQALLPSERSAINPRAYDMRWNAALARFEMNQIPSRTPFLDIERVQSTALGATPEQHFEAQQNEQQRLIANKTKENIEKGKTERKKTSDKKALGDAIDARREALAKLTPTEEATNATEKKTRTDEQDAKKVEFRHSQARDQHLKDISDRTKATAEITASTGVGAPEVTTYTTQNTIEQERTATVAKLKAEIAELTANQDSLLDRAKKGGIPTTDANGNTTITPNAGLLTQATDLTPEITGREGRLKTAQTELESAQAAKKLIVDAHKGANLTDAQMQTIVQNEAANVLSTAEVTRLNLALTAIGVTTPQTAEAVQKEIDALQVRIDGIGSERVQARQAELLESFKTVMATETQQNTRLQEHIQGVLPDIPDAPHLAGYPRLYLRTLQIMFGGDIIDLAKQADMQKYVRLFPPQDFALMVTGRPDMYNPTLNTNVDAKMITMINAAFMKQVRDNLEARVRANTLGTRTGEVTAFTQVNALKAETAADQPFINTNLIPAVLGGIPHRVIISRGTPPMPIPFANEAQINAYIAGEAAHFYHYENVQDLARRIMEDQRWFAAGGGMPLDPVPARIALYMAQQIDQYKKDHP